MKFIEENSASQCHRDIHYPHRQLETSNFMENVSSNLCFLHFDNLLFCFLSVVSSNIKLGYMKSFVIIYTLFATNLYPKPLYGKTIVLIYCAFKIVI